MSRKDGKPCKRCGTSEWDNNHDCKACAAERKRRWAQKNPEKERERKRRWAQKNPEKERKRKARYEHKNPDRRARWARANPDKERERKRRWVRADLDRNRARVTRYRARQAGAEGSFTAKEFKDLCKRYGNRCLACGEKAKLTPDHVIPLSRGGSNTISNIQPLCLSCNQSKYTNTTDYRTKGGFGGWIQRKLFNE